MPAVSPVTVVVRLLLVMVAGPPLVLLQPVALSVVPGAGVTVPFSCTLLVGRVMVWFGPAYTIGAEEVVEVLELLTVIVTLEDADKPLLSVAVRVNT